MLDTHPYAYPRAPRLDRKGVGFYRMITFLMTVLEPVLIRIRYMPGVKLPVAMVQEWD